MEEKISKPKKKLRWRDNEVVSGQSSKGNLPYFLLLCVWVALTLAIFLWVISNSLKTSPEIFGSSWSLPQNPILNGLTNYRKAWNISNMGGYFINSIAIAFGAVILTVGFSAPAAYALARIPFLGSRPIFYYFIAGMGLPFQLVLVPLYVLFVKLGLINSQAGLILALTAVSIPFTILLLTGFFRSLPTELEEAAAIDGASEFGIFLKIMMPVATPGLFTAAIFNFVAIWQEYLLTSMLINSDSKKTLPVGLMSMRQSLQYSGDWASMFAGIVIVVVPSFIIFIGLSNRIMAGLTMGTGK